jgi:hypothetical protein
LPILLRRFLLLLSLPLSVFVLKDVKKNHDLGLWNMLLLLRTWVMFRITLATRLSRALQCRRFPHNSCSALRRRDQRFRLYSKLHS